jgi:hypothetical protein
MDVLILISIALVLLFGFVVMRGAPYLPTLRAQQQTALELLDLKKGQTLLELGSGDGRMLAYAASKGIKSIGIELNPVLVLWTRVRYWRYRKLICVSWGDFWLTSWPQSDGMYVFLLDKYMAKLDTKIIQYSGKKSYKVASYTFTIPDKKPVMTKNGIHLYHY